MELLATRALRFNKARTVKNIHQLLRAGATYSRVKNEWDYKGLEIYVMQRAKF